MADANLDVIIRQLAKQQHKTLMAAVKKQRDRTIALATKAKDTETKQRYRQIAKEALEIGTATVKRLQMSADNAAYSYARSIRQAAEAPLPKKAPAPKAPLAKSPAPKKAAPPAKKSAKKTAKKTGKKKKA